MSDLRNFLQTFQNEKGQTLDTHIENTLTKLLLKNPKNWFESFEDESLRTKQKSFSLQNLDVDDNSKRLREKFQEVENWGNQQANALKVTFKVEQEIVEGGEDEEQQEQGGDEERQANNVPNVLEDFRHFEQAGIHFGEEELYLLQISLAELSKKLERPLTFFGKILGSNCDYLVATLPAPEDEEANLQPHTEPRGTKGVNQQDFWVTNDVFSEWKKLPTISPRDIREARRIKHIFTGDLESKIYSSPPFSNSEAYLLKAQLVRIFFATDLCPAKQWKPTEDEDQQFKDLEPLQLPLEPFEDELKPASNAFMCKLENWQHYQPQLLRIGRIQHIEPQDIEDEDVLTKAKRGLQENDPFAKRLKPITEDNGNGLPCAWNIRQYGDMNEYPSNTNPKFQKPYKCHGCVVIDSLIWPGWKKCVQNGNHFNVYVGYGQKFTTDLQYRTLVHEVMEEPMHMPCCPEPTPLHEVEVTEKQEQQE